MAGKYNPNDKNENDVNSWWDRIHRANNSRLQKEKFKEMKAHHKEHEYQQYYRLLEAKERLKKQSNDTINNAIGNAQSANAQITKANADVQKTAINAGTERMRNAREENEKNDQYATDRYKANLDAQKSEHKDNADLEKAKVSGNASKAQSFAKVYDDTLKANAGVRDQRKPLTDANGNPNNANPQKGAQTMEELLKAGGSHRKTEVDENGNKHTTVTEGVGNPYKPDKIDKVKDMVEPDYDVKKTDEKDIENLGNVKTEKYEDPYQKQATDNIDRLTKEHENMMKDYDIQPPRRGLWADIKTTIGNKIRDKLHIHHYDSKGVDMDATNNENNIGGGGGNDDSSNDSTN